MEHLAVRVSLVLRRSRERQQPIGSGEVSLRKGKSSHDR
jgi:hypothetical protein